MLLKDLIKNLTPKRVEGKLDKDIKGIKYDSRRVEKGDIFICISGFNTDGHLYASSAVENGATAVLVEKEVNVSKDVTVIEVSDTRAAMADLAACFYDYPSKKLNLIGVTGTNGKTTTTFLIKRILEEAGYSTGLLGTIANLIGDEELPAVRTTPESVDLQFLLHGMVEKGARYAVMEVSSHALELERVRGCYYRSAVFTNISQDHLDFHDSIESYVNAKVKLFKMLNLSYNSYGVVNGDDDYSSSFQNACSVPVLKFSTDKDGDIVAKNIDIRPEGASFTVQYPKGEVQLNLKLTGMFSVYNSLAAFAVGYQEGISPQVIKMALEESKGVPGRYEKIDCGQDFTVIVDYAHTPDSLKNILETTKEFARGRIITVFGCGGDRDRIKRPLMGEVAALNSDMCVVTSDNPRSEEPEAIIDDILPGVKKHTEKYTVVVDREEAIKHALELANKEDIVIIAGKGHETYQEIKGVKYPFDDREVVRKILCKR